MLKPLPHITPNDLLPSIERLVRLYAHKRNLLQRYFTTSLEAPVYTVRGRYTRRGWTDWTRGFVYGCALLHFEMSGEESSLAMADDGIRRFMPVHLTHSGGHDHGFNIISTYGNRRRLIAEGLAPSDDALQQVCETALKVSGAVQAARWTRLNDDEGFIYSFNGPHSLFIDTMRSLRSLAAAHALGHELISERDRRIDLLHRLLQHADATARWCIGGAEKRDGYDVPGRATHEAIFSTLDGSFRCLSTQQGYSPFTTWMRGLAWAITGFAEQLDFLETCEERAFPASHPKRETVQRFASILALLCEYYIAHCPTDSVPYWDDGAPGLNAMPDWMNRPADPFNNYEPVDSSAAAIAAQGFLLAGDYFRSNADEEKASRYTQTGLTIAATLFSDAYLSLDPSHEGLLLHSVYHRPAGWDYIPEGRSIPCGESSMWGDYHALELALIIKRMAEEKPMYSFFRHLLS